MKKSSNIQLFITSVIVGTIFSYPIAGFFEGFVNCYECDGIFGILDRLYKGIVGAITSTFTLGERSYNGNGIGGGNIHTSVLITAIILSLVLFVISKIRQNKIK